MTSDPVRDAEDVLVMPCVCGAERASVPHGHPADSQPAWTDWLDEEVVWLCHRCELGFEPLDAVEAFDCRYCGNPCERDPAHNEQPPDPEESTQFDGEVSP